MIFLKDFTFKAFCDFKKILKASCSLFNEKHICMGKICCMKSTMKINIKTVTIISDRDSNIFKMPVKEYF